MSNLIDIDLQEYEPEEDPEESAPGLVEVRSAGRAGVRPRSEVTLPHPLGRPA